MADSINFDRASLAWTLVWDADWMTAVSFLGSARLAAGNNLGQIFVWDLPEKPGSPAPPPVRRLDGHTNVISKLLPTPDGRSLVSASYDHTIRVWDAEAGGKGSATVVLNARARAEAEERRRSGRKVPPAVEATVRVQSPARTLQGHREWVMGMALSRDSKLLVSGDDGGQVIVQDFASGKELKRWTIKGWAHALALSPDDNQVLVSERRPLVFDSGRHAGIRLWERATGKQQHDLGPTFKGMYISAAVYSLDGKLLALGRGGETDGNGGKVFLVDPSSGKKLKELNPGHTYGVTDLAIHPDGKHLASCGRDTMVRLWSLPDGKLVKELGKPRGGQFKDWIHAISFSADGKWLAAADMIGSVHVWSLTS